MIRIRTSFTILTKGYIGRLKVNILSYLLSFPFKTNLSLIIIINIVILVAK